MNNSRVFSISACKESSPAASVKYCNYQRGYSHGCVYPTVYYSAQTFPLMGAVHTEDRPLRVLFLCDLGSIDMIYSMYSPAYSYRQTYDRLLRTELWL